MKSGWKTTEFWLTLLAVVLGAFVTSGLLPSEHALVKVAGMALVALGTLGYGVSRGMAKLGVLLPLLLVLPACSTTLATHLERAHIAVTEVDALALPLFASGCLQEAQKCGPVGKDACPGWVECDGKRQQYKVAIDTIDAQLGVLNRLVVGLEVP